MTRKYYSIPDKIGEVVDNLFLFLVDPKKAAMTAKSRKDGIISGLKYAFLTSVIMSIFFSAMMLLFPALNGEANERIGITPQDMPLAGLVFLVCLCSIFFGLWIICNAIYTFLYQRIIGLFDKMPDYGKLFDASMRFGAVWTLIYTPIMFLEMEFFEYYLILESYTVFGLIYSFVYAYFLAKMFTGMSKISFRKALGISVTIIIVTIGFFEIILKLV